MAELCVDVGSIGSHFESLTDPRHTRNREHLLVDMVVISICGILCGASGPTAIHRWAKSKREWLAEVLSNVVDEVVSQAATLGRMMPSWNLGSLATSMRCFAASRVRQWCEADSASLKSIVSVALRVPLPLVRR